MCFDQAVRVGDTLKVGDIQGTVDHIGLRSTRMRTPDRTRDRPEQPDCEHEPRDAFRARQVLVPSRRRGSATRRGLGSCSAVVDGIRRLLERAPVGRP